MKTPSNSDRIYLAVKREVLSGRFAPGERIDAMALAQEQFASITPIRAALYRLVGERLIQTQASEGFHTPPLTEIGLRDLLTCNGQILVHAVAASVVLQRRSEVQRDGEGEWNSLSLDLVAATESVFLLIAHASGSEECTTGIASFNDRLHAVRRLEVRLVDNGEAELEHMLEIYRTGNATTLRTAVNAYHRRRMGLVPAFVRLRHRSAGE